MNKYLWGKIRRTSLKLTEIWPISDRFLKQKYYCITVHYHTACVSENHLGRTVQTGQQTLRHLELFSDYVWWLTPNWIPVGETIRQDKMDFRRLKFWAKYGKCLKISNTFLFLKKKKKKKTFLFLFSNKMLVIRAGIHNMVVRIAKSEDPDQTATTKTLIRLLLQMSHEHLISSQSLPSNKYWFLNF